MTRKIGLILALTLASILSGLTPAHARPQRVATVHQDGRMMSVTIPNDGHLYEVGNVALRSGIIGAGSTVCFFVLRHPDVRGTGYGPVFFLSGDVDCRMIPASFGNGVPALMWSVTVNVGLQQWDGPGLYHNHWNGVGQGHSFTWNGWVQLKHYDWPAAGCIIAYEAWKFRQVGEASGITGQAEVMWPVVDWTSGIYWPGCRSLL